VAFWLDLQTSVRDSVLGDAAAIFGLEEWRKMEAGLQE
jgi:hypothetical protein